MVATGFKGTVQQDFRPPVFSSFEPILSQMYEKILSIENPRSQMELVLVFNA